MRRRRRRRRRKQHRSVAVVARRGEEVQVASQATVDRVRQRQRNKKQDQGPFCASCSKQQGYAFAVDARASSNTLKYCKNDCNFD